VGNDIVSKGGYVHPNLEFSEANRKLSVNQKISKGEIVLRIPFEVCMTKSKAFSMCQPWLEKIIKLDETNLSLKNSTADLAIAIAMAACCSLDNYPYLHSLPESSSFDALPRRWTESEIQRLLAGTSLLRHAVEAKTSVIQDYMLLRERFCKREVKMNQSDFVPSFPSFEKFSDALAAITSRAFQIGITDQDIAIVPILDLGNHTRGKATNKFQKKNVSYQYNPSEDAMIVTSAVDIDYGESIRLTYGAKSNAQLLLNYGFCILENLEQDGSSNDVLEFRPLSTPEPENYTESPNRDRGKIILLRAGPKSYSYGGFIAAFEEYYCKKKVGTEHGNGIEKTHVAADLSEQSQNDDFSDFEDFLCQCDDAEENYDEFMEIYEGKGQSTRSTNEDRHKSKKTYEEEMEALRRFKLDLIKRSKEYNICKDMQVPTMAPAKLGFTWPQYYSHMLSISELRTIYFFLRSIDKIQNLLHEKSKEVRSPDQFDLHVVTDLEDLHLIDMQTDDLANAYMSIRHGIF